MKIISVISMVFFFGLNSLYSQNITDSPYSRYGIGLIQTAKFNGNFGMGGAGIAWRASTYKPQLNDSLAKSNSGMLDRSTNYINPANPASFSNISLTTFEFSILSSFASYSSTEQEVWNNNTYFNHLALAFPITEYWGAGFGIRPYSSVGYEYGNTQSINNGEKVDFSYQGSGGANQFFISNSFEIKKRLSLGFSASYIFGNIANQRRVVFNETPSSFNSLEINEFAMGDFLFDLGFQYYANINNDYRLTIGATASLDNSLEARASSLLRTYVGREGYESYKDTVHFSEDNEIEVDIPLHYGLGFALEQNGKWIAMLDYRMRIWSIEDFTSNVSATNGHLIQLSYENLAEYTGIGSYISRLGYRAGIQYNTSILSIDGNDVAEYGISFGTSLPLRKSFSMLIFGIELLQRGTHSNNLIKENFINLHLGVTINDKWFIQSKYD